MANNEKWIRRVIYKLNTLYLEGSDFNDRRWVFDWDDNLTAERNLDNVFDEDRAVEMLTQSRIISSRSIPNRYRDDQLVNFDLYGIKAVMYSDWYSTDPAHREYNYIRAINDFNYENFVKFCELQNIKPNTSGIPAEIKIINGATPRITIDNTTYTLKSLDVGSIPQSVIQFASKYLDQELSLDKIQHNTKNAQLKSDKANLRQFFKNNIFSKNNTLGMFTDIGPRIFTLKSTAILTPSECESIKEAAQK